MNVLLSPQSRVSTPALTRCIVLLELYWMRDKDPRQPLGQASLAASLARAPQLDVHRIARPINHGYDAADIVAQIAALTAGLSEERVDIAFGAFVWNVDAIRDIMIGLRADGVAGRFIVGGPEVSYSGPGLEERFPLADAFVRGYGEDALFELCQLPFRSAIQGVHWAGEVDTVGHASAELEELPSPWLNGEVDLRTARFVRWETQRGCVFKCSFCQHRNPEARPASRVLDRTRLEAEIDLFCSAGVDDIAVLDPIFNANRAHAVWVLEAIAARGFRGRLSLQCRAEYVDDAFIAAATGLNVRLEFGLQTIHRNEGRAVLRLNSLRAIERALNAVRAAELDHEVSVIFGLPEQTLHSFEETIAWCLRQRVPVIKAFPLLALQGTELQVNAAKWGLKTDPASTMPIVVRSDSFSRQDWDHMSGLSEALKHTEGDHPATIAGLRDLALELAPDLSRWTPS